jgi:hypothetical protein
MNISHAFTFPSNFNTGLALISGVGLLINILSDTSNSRIIIDTRHGCEHIKIPHVVLN